MNHQDIPFIVEYQKGSLNQVDYMSRHARKLSSLPVDQRRECNDLNNLLYTLHMTQVVDHISLARIAQETTADKTLSQIQKYLRMGYQTIPKNVSREIRKFGPIMSDLTIVANGIIFKDDRIVLPESLHKLAIELAHRGSHPGRSGIERRLRFHFFFHEMYNKVKDFVNSCNDCALFVDKKTKEPITSHKVPENSWETVAVDLFGPMPSSKHVVVVQDLGSRYPAAKLVTSTKAEKVIPALTEIYDEYGYPENQISDNGPPFSSKKMREFTENHGVATRFSSPHFPSQNPAETFMKTVGKAMKINQRSKNDEARI
ncbi:MAG: DDE-type integrase/transposase/recombinase, partial [Bacteroidota bacterium]